MCNLSKKQVKTSTHHKIQEDLDVSKASIKSQISENSHKKVIASTYDFYTEWFNAPLIESPDSGSFKNYTELPKNNKDIRQAIKHKNKPLGSNPDADISNCLNEIYNRPDLCILP